MVTIQQFRETVIKLKPGNFMAMGGAAAGIIGGASSGGDALLSLQRSAIEFSRQYSDPYIGDVTVARKDVTGKIMIAVTLDAITEQRADELLDMISQLMKERK